MSARTRLRPGNWTLARTQARGRPKISDSPVAHSEQISDSLSASSATGVVKSDHKVDHDTFESSPTSGMARKPTVTVARVTTNTDGRRALVGVLTAMQL